MGNRVVGIILGPNIKIGGSRITLAYLDITITEIGPGAEVGQHSKEGNISTQYANLLNAAQSQPLDQFQQTYKKSQVSVLCVHLIAQI